MSYKINNDNNKHTIKSYLAEETRETDNGVGIVPIEDMELREVDKLWDSMLKDFMNFDKPFGFEYIYDDYHTYINLLYDNEYVDNIDKLTDGKEVVKFGKYKQPEDILQNNTYYRSFTIQFKYHHWFSIKHPNAEDKDLMRYLISKLTKDGDEQMDIAIQFTFRPVHKREKYYNVSSLYRSYDLGRLIKYMEDEYQKDAHIKEDVKSTKKIVEKNRKKSDKDPSWKDIPMKSVKKLIQISMHSAMINLPSDINKKNYDQVINRLKEKYQDSLFIGEARVVVADDEEENIENVSETLQESLKVFKNIDQEYEIQENKSELYQLLNRKLPEQSYKDYTIKDKLKYGSTAENKSLLYSKQELMDLNPIPSRQVIDDTLDRDTFDNIDTIPEDFIE